MYAKSLKAKTLFEVQKNIQALKDSTGDSDTNCTIINKVMQELEESNIENKKKLITLLSNVKEDIEQTAESVKKLSKMVRGIRDLSDERMEQGNLEIIEDGFLVHEITTPEQLMKTDQFTKRLHKHSFVYHCLSSPEVYDIRFPRCSMNKKQKG